MVTVGPEHRAMADALGARATVAAPLGPLTTYGVGGAAAVLVEVEGPADLDDLRTALRGSTLATYVVGRGSNLLVADAGFDGIAVQLGSGFAGLAVPDREGHCGEDRGGNRDGTSENSGEDAGAGPGGHAVVTAGASLALPVLARRVADSGWSGLSWAVGVPGSVGGAVRMNAGGHGSDMAACVTRYTWVDLLHDEGGTDDVARLDYAYRHSSVTSSQVVLEAQLVVTPGSVEEEKATVASIVKWRRQHQPGGANAGSVFTNPDGDSAGRLIDEAGLKGHRLGSAHVSEKHANFIQADRGGSADDVRALMEHVQAVVEARCGVVLQPEVRLLGFGGGKTGDVDARVPGGGQ